MLKISQRIFWVLPLNTYMNIERQNTEINATEIILSYNKLCHKFCEFCEFCGRTPQTMS